ncbi:VCBS repeat-containing protein [Streptomyces sp. NPDC046977]|uniref:FG-GAP repeat domain-containing protein n=1 Tax=Streptomyces sp. NPDC046977 TaxID=3154703 RepID=UPI0033EF0AF2
MPRSGLAAVVVALAVGVGASPWTPAPAAAAPAAGDDLPSLTLRGQREQGPRWMNLVTADASGYLTGAPPAGLFSEAPRAPVAWVGPDGRTLPAPVEPLAVNGGFGLERVGSTSTYRIRHYATGALTTFQVPATDTVTKIFAQNRLLTRRIVDGKGTLHLWEIPAGGGAPVDREVSGVLPDITGYINFPTSDAQGAAFEYTSADGTAWHTVLLDFATAHLSYVPPGDFRTLDLPHLAGDKVSFVAIKIPVTQLYVVDRDRPDQPGTKVASLDGLTDMRKARVIGDWVVYPESGGSHRLRAVPLAGGPAVTLLAGTDFQGLVDAADGSLYVAGGSDAAHWAVQHITVGADGTPTAAAVAEVPDVSVWETGGVAVDQGRLLLGTEHEATASAGSGTDLYGSDLSLGANGRPTAGPLKNLGDLSYEDPGDGTGDPGSGPRDVPCYGECLHFVGNGEADFARMGFEDSPVVAASGPYRVERRSATSLAVTGNGVSGQTQGDWKSAALWGDTLWRPGSTLGTVTVSSLPKVTQIRTENDGATCVPTDLQVVGRWIYWSCGPDGDAGVWDRTTKKLIHVPSGYAQLADGYLVSQDNAAGKLMITYFPGAVPADRVGTGELGPLAVPWYAEEDQRGRMWGVDRFGGPVAYRTANGDMTVKWPQVTLSPPTAFFPHVPSVAELRHGGTWTASWNMSKPVRGGAYIVNGRGAVALVPLTYANGRATITWDGKGIDGRTPVSSGKYGYIFRTTPANAADQQLTITGSFVVHSVDRHDYTGDGIGDILTLDTKGNYAIHPGNGKGGIDSARKVSAGGWPSTYYLTAMGDMTGDRVNDLVVRTSSGSLVRYNGVSGKPFSTTGTHATVGTGFGGYNVITSPGDLDGDGRPDLLTRDTAGTLWLYAADGKGGFSGRVAVAHGVTAYNRIIGAGDLNGDGLGDLIGRDTKGDLWRWLGNGKGNFNARVHIAKGVSAYNTLLVEGDLTGDGRPDLVGRDASGHLYRWSGNAKGTFDSRAQIASGWNTYRSLS